MAVDDALAGHAQCLDAKVAVVIVNWRTAELVAACLKSLVPERSRFATFEVVVVDNDSQDGSAERLEQLIAHNNWNAWAQVLRSPRNGGFAAGNNIGIRTLLASEPKPHYVLLLNPDTYIRPGAVAVLAEFLAKHPRVGVVGGRSEDPDATPQHCCFRFPSIVDELAAQLNLGLFDRVFAGKIARVGIPEESIQVDWVSGGVMMVRREIFEQMGLMDESYFLYFEETDFTLRARRAGWLCWHVPHSRVVHLVGQSSGVKKRDGAPARLPAYWFESRRRYFVLNHGFLYAAGADLAVIGGSLVAAVRSLVQPGRRRSTPHFLSDLLRHSVLWRGRRGIAPRRITL
jgi:N-acetylglucosaminyl-diphospho-decaprenol L-rhamnosyltransferase